MLDRLEQFEYDMGMLANLKPFAAINFIRNGIGYDDYIKDYADYKGVRPDEMMDFLDELQEEAKSYDNFDDWFEYIKAYSDELKEQAAKSRMLNNGQEQSDAVLLMTMHGVKGLNMSVFLYLTLMRGLHRIQRLFWMPIWKKREECFMWLSQGQKNIFIYIM